MSQRRRVSQTQTIRDVSQSHGITYPLLFSLSFVLKPICIPSMVQWRFSVKTLLLHLHGSANVQLSCCAIPIPIITRCPQGSSQQFLKIQQFFARVFLLNKAKQQYKFADVSLCSLCYSLGMLELPFVLFLLTTYRYLLTCSHGSLVKFSFHPRLALSMLSEYCL